MLGKGAFVLAVGAALLAAPSARASAQVVEGYVAVPPVYVEIGPPPGPGYVWVPRFHRWEYRRAFGPTYYRDWDRWRDRREDADRYRDYDRRDYRRGDRDRR
jgi:hypothetical protein